MSDKTCCIYLVICAPPGGDFLVKIGRSCDPMVRWSDMTTAIPYESHIMYAPVGTVSVASALESAAHKTFRFKRESGEWFTIESEEFAPIFLRCISRLYRAAVGFDPDWRKVLSDQRSSAPALPVDGFCPRYCESDGVKNMAAVKELLDSEDRKEQAKVLELLTGVQVDVSEDPFDPGERARQSHEDRIRRLYITLA